MAPMPLIRCRFAPIAALLFGVVTLAACERMSTIGFDTQSAFGSVGLADRCVDIVRRAFPNGGLDIANRRVKVEGGVSIVAIAAVRRDVAAKGPYARDIAAECRFENNILMGFRWTSGPIRPTGFGQAP